VALPDTKTPTRRSDPRVERDNGRAPLLVGGDASEAVAAGLLTPGARCPGLAVPKKRKLIDRSQGIFRRPFRVVAGARDTARFRRSRKQALAAAAAALEERCGRGSMVRATGLDRTALERGTRYGGMERWLWRNAAEDYVVFTARRAAVMLKEIDHPRSGTTRPDTTKQSLEIGLMPWAESVPGFLHRDDKIAVRARGIALAIASLTAPRDVRVVGRRKSFPNAAFTDHRAVGRSRIPRHRSHRLCSAASWERSGSAWSALGSGGLCVLEHSSRTVSADPLQRPTPASRCCCRSDGAGAQLWKKNGLLGGARLIRRVLSAAVGVDPRERVFAVVRGRYTGSWREAVLIRPRAPGCHGTPCRRYCRTAFEAPCSLRAPDPAWCSPCGQARRVD